MRQMDFDEIAQLRQQVQQQTLKQHVKITPEECAKLLKVFADAQMFDVDLMHALEQLFIE